MIRKSLNGEFFVIDGDRWISAWAEAAGRLDHDQNALPIILKHIQDGMTVVDGGAHIGSHTCAYLRAVGHGGRVYAIEPNQEAFTALSANCPDAVCIKAALSADCCLGAGRLVKSDDGNSGASHIRILGSVGDVDFITLDSLNICPGFIKLDLEGFELRALRGAVETINRCRPTMVVEVNQSALDRQGVGPGQLLGFISTLGYSYQNIYPKQDCVGEQFDVLCKPL